MGSGGDHPCGEPVIKGNHLAVRPTTVCRGGNTEAQSLELLIIPFAHAPADHLLLVIVQEPPKGIDRPGMP
jgi:hypothetical protein